MTTKEKLLEIFEKNRNTYFSGEALAKQLSVSRAAIWKAVKALQTSGYAIDAVTNKGYCLLEETDIISCQGIRKYLSLDISDIFDIEVHDTLDSTSTFLKGKVYNGAKEGSVVIANEQTSGRGRIGRTFYSPKDTGIYMSILLKPDNYTSDKAIKITTMAAVAACEAIEAVSGEKAMIKWVNDIFVNGKKVCGILTEGSFDMESGLMDYAVLGIGMNVYEPKNGFSQELKDIAGSILKDNVSDAKNRLISSFLNNFYKYYHSEDTMIYVNNYRERSFIIGKDISVISRNNSSRAKVLGIDDNCRLLLQYEDGKEEYCSSGEIKIIPDKEV